MSDGTFTATPTFNGYGELDGVDYDIGTSNAFEWDIVRYNTGAIQSKVETLGATTDTYAYTYDELGRQN